MNFCHQSWSSTSFSAPRTGQLAAVQAKNLLLGTGLAQQTLAGVWNLADIDKDGRCNTFSLKNFLSISNTGKLNTEEFCVAMHLCEQFQKGEPLPSQLPVRLEKGLQVCKQDHLILNFSLIPPQMRRAAKDAGLIGTPGSGMNSGLGSPASFEVHFISPRALLLVEAALGNLILGGRDTMTVLYTGQSWATGCFLFLLSYVVCNTRCCSVQTYT